jgi:hypothetical protein
MQFVSLPLARTEWRFRFWVSNTEPIEQDRESCSSKTNLALKHASDFNMSGDLTNVDLAAFRSFVALRSGVKNNGQLSDRVRTAPNKGAEGSVDPGRVKR